MLTIQDVGRGNNMNSTEKAPRIKESRIKRFLHLKRKYQPVDM